MFPDVCVLPQTRDEAEADNALDREPAELRITMQPSLTCRLVDADGLLMLGSVEPHYTASRLFPYIHSGRPILSLFHQSSDATRVLLESNAKLVVTYKSKEDVATKCEEMSLALVNLLTDGRTESRVDMTESVGQFSSRSLTGTLASISRSMAFRSSA